jgi:hypothetical protein
MVSGQRCELFAMAGEKRPLADHKSARLQCDQLAC